MSTIDIIMAYLAQNGTLNIPDLFCKEKFYTTGKKEFSYISIYQANVCLQPFPV